MGGLILMFIVMCVVLQLFAKAQFRENRSIFNTPNPRLMNVSLMKDSKLFKRKNKEDDGKKQQMRQQSIAAAAAAAHALQVGGAGSGCEVPFRRGASAESDDVVTSKSKTKRAKTPDRAL